MNRIDRLQAILTQLQTKKIVKASEIANRFDISLRTVYRDIRALEQGGIPIGAETGVGYFLDDNFSLPPVMFTTQEATALLMAGKLIPHLADKKVDDAFQAALYKIKSVLKTDDKRILDKLEKSVRVYSDIMAKPQHANIYLQEVQQALINNRVLLIEYFAKYKQEDSKREIEPIGLIYYAMNWHLIAWCRLRNAYRDFRLDRIIRLESQDVIFEHKLDKSFDAYLENEKQKYDYKEISIVVDQKLAADISETKYFYGFISESIENNKTTMKFLHPDLDGFSKWLLSLNRRVEILSPDVLIENFRTKLMFLCKSYL